MAKGKNKISAIVAITVGIVILIWNGALAVAVALFLIIYGIMDLLDK